MLARVLTISHATQLQDINKHVSEITYEPEDTLDWTSYFFFLQQDLDSVVSDWCLMNLIITSNPISNRSQGIYRRLSVPHIPPGILEGKFIFF